MTIQEAIKSGKPFRRPMYPGNYWYTAKNNVVLRSDGSVYYLDLYDILANDWEVKQIPRTLWINVREASHPQHDEYEVYDCEITAMRKAAKGLVTRKFVEVIE